MEKFKLKLEAREARKPNQLRRAGKIPATIYGPGVPSATIQVEAMEFSRLPAAAYSHIIELQGGQEGTINAIIRNVQRKHVSQEVLNIEFYRVASDRKLTVTVPLKFSGSSEAVTAGGQLMTNFDEAEVECFPQDIPDFIAVDISRITELDQGIHFGDLSLPDTVKILNPNDEIIVRVVSPRTGTEPGAATEATPTPAAAGAAS